MKLANNFVTALLTLLAVGCASKQQPADLLITGGKIYTVNDRQPLVEAVAVRGNRIVYAGAGAEAEKYNGDDTRRIDLAGKVMIPGFIEGHGHIMGVGY